MTTIYFIRHAITQMNIDKIYHGDRDVPLSPEGYEQLKYLSAAFKDIPLTAVYSSPLERAVLSAKAVAEPHNLNVEVLQLLSERKVGPFECMLISDMYADPVARPLLMSNVPLNPPEGVEPPGIVQQRYVSAVETILDQSAGGIIGVAVHGFALQMYLAHVLDIPLEKFSRLKMGNASVTRIDYDEMRKPTLQYVDKRDFLPDCLQTENIAVKIDDEAEKIIAYNDWNPVI